MKKHTVRITLTRFLALITLLLVALLWPTTTQAQSDTTAVPIARQTTKDPVIYLQSRTFAPQTGVEPMLLLNRTGATRRHGIIQFHTLPDAAQQAALQDAGIELLAYVPENAWLASFPTSISSLQSVPSARWIGELQSTDKVDPLLQNSPLNADMLDLWVTVFPDIAAADAEAVLLKHGATITGGLADFDEYYVTLPADALWTLAADDAIAWIAADPGAPQELSDDATTHSGADIVHEAPYNLSGSGVQAGVWDSGAVDTHPDFNGRLTVRSSYSPSKHATNVAGILGGDGSDSETAGYAPFQWEGTAPGADIVSYDWGNPVGSHNEAINTYGVDLSQNSWGFTACANFGLYKTYASNYDLITRGQYGDQIPVIFSAGNERNSSSNTCGNIYNTILGGPSSAKNVITVGAIATNDTIYNRSSWGPTADGRIKPEIVAVGVGVTSTCLNSGYCGYNGTSQAAPSVSGAVALALEQYENMCPDSGPRPLPATFRALLAHTATDLNDSTAHFNLGPDFASGYGKLNIPALVDAVPYHYEGSLTDGEVQSFTINVPAGQTELKVTLAWDDAPAAYNAAVTIINDLDVELIDPNGSVTYGPWQLDATPGNEANPATRPSWTKANQAVRDERNVMEQIVVDNPTAGSWTIRVIGSSVPEGPQSYALANRWLANTSCAGTPANDPAPEPVMGHVEISLEGAQIRLAWPHDTANAAYEIWTSDQPYFEPGDANASLLDTITATADPVTYLDTTSQEPGNYFYIVRAINSDNVVSESSNRVGIYNHSTQ